MALSQWTTFHLKGLGFRNTVAVYADKRETSCEISQDEKVKVNGNLESLPPNTKLAFSDGSLVLKRGYDKLVFGRKVIVAEDVLTTGGSALRTAEAVKRAGGEVVMAAAVCNRGGVTAEAVGAPFLDALLNVSLEKYPEDKCPLCEQGVPVNISVGHGAAFLAKKSAAVK